VTANSTLLGPEDSTHELHCRLERQSIFIIVITDRLPVICASRELQLSESVTSTRYLAQHPSVRRQDIWNFLQSSISCLRSFLSRILRPVPKLNSARSIQTQSVSQSLYTHSIYCGNERSPSLISDVDCESAIRNLLESIFNILPVFMRQWEIETHLHGSVLV
jgi:hypothetical protein